MDILKILLKRTKTELKTQNGLNSRLDIAKKMIELEYLSKNIQTDIRAE